MKQYKHFDGLATAAFLESAALTSDHVKLDQAAALVDKILATMGEKNKVTLDEYMEFDELAQKAEEILDHLGLLYMHRYIRDVYEVFYADMVELSDEEIESLDDGHEEDLHLYDDADLDATETQVAAEGEEFEIGVEDYD